MLNRFLCILLTVSCLLLFPCTAFAGTERSAGDDIPRVFNTVDYSGVSLCLDYFDMSSRSHTVRSYCNSEGYVSLARPADYASFGYLYIEFNKKSLPASGRYNFSISFSSNTGVTYDSAILTTDRRDSNVLPEEKNMELSFIQSSGDFYASAVIDLGRVDSFYLTLYPFNDFVPPFGGYIKAKFAKTEAEPNYVSAGGSHASTDKIVDSVQDTANNTAALVDKQDTIIDQIVDTTQTISNQLHSFWNQLAGEFTNMYAKWNQHHAQQLESDRNNTEDIIDSQESNTTTIINNQNENTEKIVNGYDNSGLTSSNDTLKDSLSKMEEQEDKAMEYARTAIDDFQYDDGFFSRFTAPIADVSYFMNHVYSALAGLNIPIGFSLTLTIAMLCIGYYRFKGGS